MCFWLFLFHSQFYFLLQQFGQPGQSVSLPGHAQGGHNQSFQQQQEFLRQQQEYK